jgi:hypothetical protein
MSTTGDETSGDYAYDMAHDDVSPHEAGATRTPATDTQAAEPTEPPDSDGDYSYDLAHEVPRSGSQG